MRIFKFRSTITTLDIREVHAFPDEFADIITYTSRFPNLKSLQLCEFGSCPRLIDFNRLVLANPKLRDLLLVGLSIGRRYTLDDTQRK
jgi:hypothetical protein